MSQLATETRVPSQKTIPQGAWKQWIPALVWLGIICFESTDLLSSAHTGSILYSVVTFLFGRVNPIVFLVWHHLLRKAGHVTGYAILSYLLFRAWRTTLPLPNAVAWSFAWARISFFMTSLVATLDEWHQTFIPSRGGSLSDVLLDSTAALGAQFILWFFLKALGSPYEETFTRLDANNSMADTTASTAEK
ncbi:MAG TPA: VanZ family protein [Terriglobales bacterium]|nr:VanZ family protein [Terriglobales bacterium]